MANDNERVVDTTTVSEMTSATQTENWALRELERPVDKLGRVVIPKELRDTFDIQKGDKGEVLSGEDTYSHYIVLRFEKKSQ